MSLNLFLMGEHTNWENSISENTLVNRRTKNFVGAPRQLKLFSISGFDTVRLCEFTPPHMHQGGGIR